MRRSQRTVHRALWPVLALVVSLTVGFTTGTPWRLASFISLVLLGLVAFHFPRIGVSFMPALDEGSTLDMPITVPRAGITQSADDLKARNALLRGFPEVESVIGAFMLIRRVVWLDLGGLDERYFFFLEETDFCVQARQHGWKLGVVDAVAVAHLSAPVAEGYPREEAVAEARAFLDGRPYVPREQAQRTLVSHRSW